VTVAVITTVAVDVAPIAILGSDRGSFSKIGISSTAGTAGRASAVAIAVAVVSPVSVAAAVATAIRLAIE